MIQLHAKLTQNNQNMYISIYTYCLYIFIHCLYIYMHTNIYMYIYILLIVEVLVEIRHKTYPTLYVFAQLYIHI